MEQTYEWIRLAQAGDAAAKDNLLQENSGLIWSVVGRFRHARLPCPVLHQWHK